MGKKVEWSYHICKIGCFVFNSYFSLLGEGFLALAGGVGGGEAFLWDLV